MTPYQNKEKREEEEGAKAPVQPLIDPEYSENEEIELSEGSLETTQPLSHAPNRPPTPNHEILVSPTKLATMVQTYSYEAFEMHWEKLDVGAEIKVKLDEEIKIAINLRIKGIKDNAIKILIRLLGVISVGVNIYFVF